MIQVHENPDIFLLHVPLPNNPLRNLNCYVIKDGGDALIIDTGFNVPACKEALLHELGELQLDWDKTHLFLTHFHSDHVGLAPVLMKGKPGNIYMSKADHLHFIDYIGEKYAEHFDPIFKKEGFLQEHIDYLHSENVAVQFGPDEAFPAVHVADSDTIQVGKYNFQCIITPGHTPGHTCLYLPEQKLLFAADHILFDITPNITYWLDLENSLNAYLNSLVKIHNYDVEKIFVGHRNNNENMYQRVEQLLGHHYKRLNETLELIDENPLAHATKIASLMKWSMRGKHWDDFPVTQRWFAVGETLSHLDYFVHSGHMERVDGEEFRGYRLLKDLATCKAELSGHFDDFKSRLSDRH
ncbi:MAG: MBL fold metallo-hydrolase [Bacillota bacterium]